MNLNWCANNYALADIRFSLENNQKCHIHISRLPCFGWISGLIIQDWSQNFSFYFSEGFYIIILLKSSSKF